MSEYKVTIQKLIIDYYLIEADSEEEASTIAQEGTFIIPAYSEEIFRVIKDVEKL